MMLKWGKMMNDEEYRKRGEEAYWELQRVIKMDFSDKPEKERQELEADRRKLIRYLHSISIEPATEKKTLSKEERDQYIKRMRDIFGL